MWKLGPLTTPQVLKKKISFNVTYLTIQFNYILLNLVQAKFEELVENEAFSIFKDSSNTIDLLFTGFYMMGTWVFNSLKCPA